MNKLLDAIQWFLVAKDDCLQLLSEKLHMISSFDVNYGITNDDVDEALDSTGNDLGIKYLH